MLRRGLVVVALAVLLTGCSGQTGPSALDRSICQQAKQLVPDTTYEVSTPSSVRERTIVGAVPNTFIELLKKSPDPVFHRLGYEMSNTWHTQLDGRCSVLGL